MQMKIGEDYVAAVRQQGECTLNGDYKTGNQAYSRMMELLHELRKLPDKGESVLLGLLDDPDDWVKLWASTHLLPIREDIACASLETLASGRSSLSEFNAKMVLKEWRSGRLKVE